MIIPQLTATLNFNQDYLIKSLKAMRNLTQCQLKYLSVLSKLQIIDYTKDPSVISHQWRIYIILE